MALPFSSNNAFVNTQMITNTALPVFVGNLAIARSCDNKYSDMFGKPAMKIGQSLSINRPKRFKATFGASVTPQSLVSTYFNLPIEVQLAQSFGFTDVELKFNALDIAKNYMYPASVALAEEVERYVSAKVSGSVISWLDSTGATQTIDATQSGTTSVSGSRAQPSSFQTFSQLKADYNNRKATLMDRRVFITPNQARSIINAERGSYNPTVNEDAYSGYVSNFAGFDVYESVYLNTQTYGNYGANAITVVGSPANGSNSINVAGLANGSTLNKGDLFSIAGVYVANNDGKSAGQLALFRVTSNVTSTSATSQAVGIFPALNLWSPSNLYGIHTALPASGAAVTPNAAAGATVGLPIAFPRQAVAIAFSEGETHKGSTDESYVMDMDNPTGGKMGMPMTYNRYYLGNNGVSNSRLEVVLGAAVVQPEEVFILGASDSN